MQLQKTYAKAAFYNGVLFDQFFTEVESSGFVSTPISMSEDEHYIYIFCDEIIDETNLDHLVAFHIPDFTTVFVQKTIRQNIDFSIELIQKLKLKNIFAGLSSIDQALWVHHRLRRVDMFLSDDQTQVSIDVLNLVISGDVETAEKVLSKIQPDDMTEDYHWLTEDLILWIRNEIRAYLGWTLL
jgi:hypothetical protein